MSISTAARAIVEGRHHDPFNYLGWHREGGEPVVRVFLPEASGVKVLDDAGHISELPRIHAAGLFAGPVEARDPHYRLRARFGDNEVEMEDAYRFPPILSDMDLHLLGEGTHLELYNKLGAHPMQHEGVDGVAFVVFAPNARRVSVVGDFNFWDGRRHAMRVRGNGYWEIFVPAARPGDKYKYEIVGGDGQLLPLKADPVAFAAEQRPSTASIVVDAARLPRPVRLEHHANALSAPMSIYEVHLGSWRRNPNEGSRWLTYRELAKELPDYAADMGFTHIELMPVSEHPFDGSWGYQPTGLFAPTSRFGSPEDFALLIDACHRKGLGVLLDWVPGHFPTDAHGLGQFDGTALYEHADPRQGFHQDWSTLIYNFGRTEVTNFLHANALFWFDRYHIDGLRVDAVASMLYRDYSRKSGEWIPNPQGGRENWEAVEFLRATNRAVYGTHPGFFTVAEESTAWPGVTRPAHDGGLGFGFKWNMGFMHDTLRYMARDPVHRGHHHDDITFGLLYAFSENFVLPLSHDEVVHGKSSLLHKMAGDDWQKFATLRAYYAMMWGYPGKKLLFMGQEFAQRDEWSEERALDWHHLDHAPHRGVQLLIGDLNRLYRSRPALHARDCEAEGFEWVVVDAAADSIFAWVRRAPGAAPIVVISHFTPLPRQGYRMRLPSAGRWREVVNSDALEYGGSGAGNMGIVTADEEGWANVTIPPFATLMLELGY